MLVFVRVLADSLEKEHFQDMPKVVVHTVGIGNEVDDDVLARIAELGKGEYYHATDLARLLQFYSSLARKFKILSRVIA